jgi:hypothetical protein
MKPASLLWVAAVTLLGACATVPPPTPAPPPSVTYTSFGDAQLSKDAHVVQRYTGDYMKRNPGTRTENRLARMRTPPGEELPVRVLIDALPEGIEAREGSLRVSEGSPHVLLGSVVLRAPGAFAMSREEIVEELKHLAMEAGGNIVVVSFLGGNQQEAPGATGYVLKSDLSQVDFRKSRPGKLPVEI